MKLLLGVTEASCLTSSRLSVGAFLKVTSKSHQAKTVCQRCVQKVEQHRGRVPYTRPMAQPSGGVAVLSQKFVMCS